VVVVEVAAAVIQDGAGRYLITRRPEGSHLGGLWEFPGGKREPGETLEACLARELREEVGALVNVGDRVETVRWDYPDKTVVIHFFQCRLTGGRVEPRESQALEWVTAGELGDYAFPPADQALVEQLKTRR
jgi:8-oxo-dGTP diphosphatase